MAGLKNTVVNITGSASIYQLLSGARLLVCLLVRIIVFQCQLDATTFSQVGRAHLLLVSRTPGYAGGAIGVVTLEGTLARVA